MASDYYNRMDRAIFDPSPAERRLAGQIYRFIQNGLGGAEAGTAAIAEALAAVRRDAIEILLEQVEVAVGDRTAFLIDAIVNALEAKVGK